MVEKISDPQKPTGLRRLLFRLPIQLYRLNLGWLLGGRFMLVNHVGRKSGQVRQVVLEVVKHDKEHNIYYLASGFGKKSDWYRNLQAQPDVMVQVGRAKMDVHARFLTAEESGKMMVEYGRTYPQLAKRLAQLIGYRVDGADEDYRFLGEEVIPFVALEPRIS
ncbi:MAG: nitroreductase family deazaflavin-dependent oxidoreductase [Pseudomonadota bacterium]